MYDYLIFDFDGTLSDTYPVFTEAILKLTERYGLETDYDTVYRLLKKSTSVALTYYDFGISLEQARKEFEEIYCSIAMDKQQLFPETKEILNFAKHHNKKCYIYTHSGKWVYALLDRMEIADCFEFVLDKSYDFPAKPAPDALNFICEKCAIDKSRALMIGDRDIDIDVAHNAGISACLIDSENFYEDCKAEYKINLLTELKGIILNKHKFCAHRGVSALMPENTLPAFAAALSLGADEIEFDVRLTKDCQLVVSHDGRLERISNGTGQLSDYTLEELKQLNIGVKQGWEVPFCTPEEVFEQFANKIVFNIHLKEHGENGYLIRKIVNLIEKYDAYENVYFAGSPDELEWMEKVAPNVRRVAIQLPKDEVGILEMARKYHCSGVQFWLGMFDEALIKQLHDEGIWCNLFYADDAENYEKYFSMGIDTLLTNRMDLAATYRNENRKKG